MGDYYGKRADEAMKVLFGLGLVIGIVCTSIVVALILSMVFS